MIHVDTTFNWVLSLLLQSTRGCLNDILNINFQIKTRFTLLLANLWGQLHLLHALFRHLNLKEKNPTLIADFIHSKVACLIIYKRLFALLCSWHRKRFILLSHRSGTEYLNENSNNRLDLWPKNQRNKFFFVIQPLILLKCCDWKLLTEVFLALHQ